MSPGDFLLDSYWAGEMLSVNCQLDKPEKSLNQGLSRSSLSVGWWKDPPTVGGTIP